MPIGHKHHRGVPVAPAVALGRCHEPLDLGRGQVFAGAELAVGQPFRGDCSIYGGWRDQPETRFSHDFRAMSRRYCSYNDRSSNSVNGTRLGPARHARPRGRSKAYGRAEGQGDSICG